MDLFAIILTLSISTAAPQSAPSLPATLLATLEAKVPGYHSPCSAEAMAQCSYVASDDFDSDGRLDFALLLADAHDSGGKLFAALADKKGWNLQELPVASTNLKGSWVSIPLGGLHNNVDASTWNDPNNQGFWIQRLNTTAACIESGALGASVRVFCLQGSTWRGVVVNARAERRDCGENIPESLKKSLHRRAPGMRLLRLSELEPLYADLGCFNVAQADFNGDERDDFAVLLSNDSGTATKLYVGLSGKAGWQVHELPTFTNTAAVAYVDARGPDTVEHTETYEFDPKGKPFWTNKLVAQNATLFCGKQESGGYTFAYINGAWHGVHSSN